MKRKRETSGKECFAFNCNSYQNSANSGVSFHRFPNKSKRPDLYQQWVKNCRRVGEPSKTAVVCSLHFETSMINKTLNRAQLRENAVPTIFGLPDDLRPEDAPKQMSTASVEIQCKDEETTADNQQQGFLLDHSYELSANDAKRRLLELQEENERLRKQLRNIKLKEKRANKHH